jgi:hypothetical protein
MVASAVPLDRTKLLMCQRWCGRIVHSLRHSRLQVQVMLGRAAAISIPAESSSSAAAAVPSLARYCTLPLYSLYSYCVDRTVLSYCIRCTHIAWTGSVDRGCHRRISWLVEQVRLKWLFASLCCRPELLHLCCFVCVWYTGMFLQATRYAYSFRPRQRHLCAFDHLHSIPSMLHLALNSFHATSALNSFHATSICR